MANHISMLSAIGGFLILVLSCTEMETKNISPCEETNFLNETILSLQLDCLQHEKRELHLYLCDQPGKYDCSTTWNNSDQKVMKVLQAWNYCDHISLIAHCEELDKYDKVLLERNLEVHLNFDKYSRFGLIHNTCGEYHEVKCPKFGFCLARESICDRIRPN